MNCDRQKVFKLGLEILEFEPCKNKAKIKVTYKKATRSQEVTECMCGIHFRAFRNRFERNKWEYKSELI